MSSPPDAVPPRRQLPARLDRGVAALAVLALLSGLEIHRATGSHDPATALAGL